MWTPIKMQIRLNALHKLRRLGISMYCLCLTQVRHLSFLFARIDIKVN